MLWPDARMVIVSTSRDSASDATPPNSQAPGPVVIRIPGTAYVAVFVLLMMLSLPAISWPAYCAWLLVLPVALAWWVARVRTTVTHDEIRVRTATGSATHRWAEVEGIYFPQPRLLGSTWARAALTDGSQVALPAVTWQQIPVLSKASGGKFPDVTALPKPDDTSE